VTGIVVVTGMVVVTGIVVGGTVVGGGATMTENDGPLLSPPDGEYVCQPAEVEAAAPDGTEVTIVVPETEKGTASSPPVYESKNCTLLTPVKTLLQPGTDAAVRVTVVPGGPEEGETLPYSGGQVVLVAADAGALPEASPSATRPDSGSSDSRVTLALDPGPIVLLLCRRDGHYWQVGADAARRCDLFGVAEAVHGPVGPGEPVAAGPGCES
jgi:hypothetical protein